MKGFLSLLALSLLLTGCGTPRAAQRHELDPTIVQHTTSARAAYQLGSFERAARLYELALQRARLIDHGSEIGRNAYNAAACWLRAGQADQAVPLLVEARREFLRSGDDVTRVLILEAKAARQQGRLEDASEAAARVLVQTADEGQRADVLVLQANVALDRGDLSEAESALRKARRNAGDDPTLKAALSGTEGRLKLRKGDSAGAAALFDRQARYYQTAQNYPGMVEALQASGSAWGAAGQATEAADRYYRAARSAYANGQPTLAVQLLEQGVKFATDADQRDALQQMAALLDEIRATLMPPGGEGS